MTLLVSGEESWYSFSVRKSGIETTLYDSGVVRVLVPVDGDAVSVTMGFLVGGLELCSIAFGTSAFETDTAQSVKFNLRNIEPTRPSARENELWSPTSVRGLLPNS